MNTYYCGVSAKPLENTCFVPISFVRTRRVNQTMPRKVAKAHDQPKNLFCFRVKAYEEFPNMIRCVISNQNAFLTLVFTNSIILTVTCGSVVIPLVIIWQRTWRLVLARWKSGIWLTTNCHNEKSLMPDYVETCAEANLYLLVFALWDRAMHRWVAVDPDFCLPVRRSCLGMEHAEVCGHF